MRYWGLERGRGSPECSGSGWWGWWGLGPEPRALGSLPHTLDAIDSLLQGSGVGVQLLWKAAALGDGWESGRRAVGFQMKGLAV